MKDKENAELHDKVAHRATTIDMVADNGICLWDNVGEKNLSVSENVCNFHSQPFQLQQMQSFALVILTAICKVSHYYGVVTPKKSTKQQQENVYNDVDASLLNLKRLMFMGKLTFLPRVSVERKGEHLALSNFRIA